MAKGFGSNMGNTKHLCVCSRDRVEKSDVCERVESQHVPIYTVRNNLGTRIKRGDSHAASREGRVAQRQNERLEREHPGRLTKKISHMLQRRLNCVLTKHLVNSPTVL